MRRLAAMLAVSSLLVGVGCTDDAPDDPSSTTTSAPDGTTSSTTPPPDATLDTIELDIDVVAELEEPIALAARPGSPDLYIAEKRGRVRLIEVDADRLEEREDAIAAARAEPEADDQGEEGAETSDEGEGDAEDALPDAYDLEEEPLLDLSEDVVNGDEQGLLGMAFSSDGRKLYLDYTRQPDGHSVVVEYTLGDSQRIDEDSRRELLLVEQPYPNHNGGDLVVGPDGFLYISLGDGGDGGDPDGHGQDKSTLLGSILRIDPDGAGDDGPPYAIPAGNPFADGDEGAPEIWLYGVRNPWRFSFDTGTGDLWVADVGQDSYEEINRLPAAGGFDAGRGDNLGWDQMEGTHSHDGGENPPGAVLPIFEYGRDEGCSVTGGYVYRGEAIEALQGTYLYSDYCGTGVRGLQVDGDTVIDTRTWDLPLERQHSLGQDDAGELYGLLAGGRVVKLLPGGS